MKSNRPHTWLQSARGMTIVELMIVLTIIASIMGVVAFSVMGVLANSETKTARIEMHKLSELAATYYLSQSPRAYPATLQSMTEGDAPLTQAIPLDPWGNDYIYRPVGNRFLLFSAGPDGVTGTEDDVTMDNENAQLAQREDG